MRLASIARLASLEGLLVSSTFGFGLTTATPLQRDICRIIEGKQPVSDEGKKALAASTIPGRPSEVTIVAAVRGAKSLMAAVVGVHASQHCDVSLVRRGEVPRFSIVSQRMDLASVIYNHLRGSVMGSPALRELLVSEPTADSVTLRHPSGTPIEIKVVAGARAGTTLVARWSAGVVFDEAPRMLGQGEGVVNLDDAKAAVRARLLPGAQMLSIGSPWAPFGPVYDQVREHHGKPSEALVVLRAKGPDLNPFWWTPDYCRMFQQRYPDVYQTDCLAEFLSPQAGLFGAELDAAVQKGVTSLPPDALNTYVAAIDPATRGNSWTLVVQTMEAGVRKIALCKQWTGSKQAPLDPKVVFSEIADLVRPYRVERLATDQWSYDSLRSHARDAQLALVQYDLSDFEKTEKWLDMRQETVSQKRQILDDAVLLADLRRVTKRATHRGLTIDLPLTSDGRHCDYAPALLLCEAQWIDDRRYVPTEADAANAEVQRMHAAALRSIGADAKTGRGGFRRGQR